MPTLGRGKAMILWLAEAVLLFGVSGSVWRDLVSRPAGTIVHVAVKGGELVPWLRGLAMTAILLALVSLFANRLVILVLSTLAGLLALLALIATFGKLGDGPVEVGVTSHFFWLPAVSALIGIAAVFLLAIATPLSARNWTNARYQAGKMDQVPTPTDLWRAQDAGIDPTKTE